MLTYRDTPQSDPFHFIYSSRQWLSDYDPPGPFPLWINIEPTNVCQLKCVFCSRQLSQRPLGYLDLKMAEKVFDEAMEQKCAVRFTGWGEPLMHPELVQLVSMVKKRGIPLKIYTNGLALTAGLMEHFIDLELDDLQFSFQGLTPKQYEFNRVGASWQTLAENISMASRMRGSRKRPFLSILTSGLADELMEADSDLFTSQWLSLVDKVAVDLTNLNFVSQSEAAKPHLGRQSSGLNRGLCVDVFLAMEIKYDGAIQFCGQDAQGRETHTAGRVGEASLASVWLGPKFEAQRRLVGRALGHEKSEVCQNCYHNTTKYDLFKKVALAATGVGG